jgi:CRP-like cAMP-binding protein
MGGKTLTMPNSHDKKEASQSFQFQLMEFNPGQTIFKEGQSGKHAYLIRTGTVSIFKMVAGQKHHLTTMFPGQILGEMAIINEEPRSASAEAKEYCQLLVMDESTLTTALQDTLPIIKALLNQLIHRIKETDQKHPVGKNDRAEAQHKHIINLERGVKSIQADVADWIMALPNMEPGAKQCLEHISKTCSRLLKK